MSEKAEYQSSVGIYQKTSKYRKKSKKKWKIEKFAEKLGKSKEIRKREKLKKVFEKH